MSKVQTRTTRSCCQLAILVCALSVGGCGDDGVGDSPTPDAQVVADGGGADAGDQGGIDGSIPGQDASASHLDGAVSEAGADAGRDTGDAARGIADAARVVDGSIADVDLTLGGFNQDLPAPSVDCVNKQNLQLGCMTVSGTYDGDTFEISCEESKLTVGMTDSHLVGCRGAVSGGDLIVELHLDPQLIGMPTTTFAANAPGVLTFASVWHLQRGFASYPDGIFKLDATHDQSFRVAGLSERVQRGTVSPPQYDWRIKGAFGLSLTPKSGCVPDTAGHGCDAVKLRANFMAYPIGG